MTTIDRFWKHVNKTDTCWTWIGAGSQGKTGDYGKFRIDGKNVYSHRFIYEYNFGLIPNGNEVCHHCDNPRCVRLEHLFLGSRKDNMKDASRKGRIVIPGLAGEKHPRAKLSETQVQELRNAPLEKIDELAARFNITRGHILRIRRGLLWTNVKSPTPSMPASNFPVGRSNASDLPVQGADDAK